MLCHAEHGYYHKMYFVMNTNSLSRQDPRDSEREFTSCDLWVSVSRESENDIGWAQNEAF